MEQNWPNIEEDRLLPPRAAPPSGPSPELPLTLTSNKNQLGLQCMYIMHYNQRSQTTYSARESQCQTSLFILCA